MRTPTRLAGRLPTSVPRNALRSQRAVLLGVVGLSAVLFWRPAADAFQLPKAALVITGAVVLVALGAVRALEARRVVVSATPYRSAYWLHLAAAREAAGDMAGARESAVRAAELDFGSARQALLVTQLAMKTGDLGLAARWFKEAAERDPWSPDTLLAAADFFDTIGQGERVARLRQAADGLARGDGGER